MRGRPPPDLPTPPGSAMVSSAGSAIFFARVDTGIIVIDLGWWGAERALECGAVTDEFWSDVLEH